MTSGIEKIFYPQTICVVGASSKEKSIGYELLKNIRDYSFTGNVIAVNPKAEEILGIKCYPDINSINAPIDLAIIVVPKQFVVQSIKALIVKKVTSFILITAGFREVSEEGAKLENDIVDLINNAGAVLVGPNCMGVINTLAETKLNATFVAEQPETGSSAFLSQSGALGAAVLNSLRETNIRFAHFISVGNKAQLNENEFIRYWQNDENIKVITLYLESFEDGFSFISSIAKGEITKPVVVLKAGKTRSGMKAASSHTGALGSEYKVVDALLNQFGVVRAADLNEMFNTAKGFENFPIPKGNRIAVVTNAGGPAILTVDKLEDEDLQLAMFSDKTKEKLKEVVHPEGSVNNPVDLLPGGTAEIYEHVIKIVLNDENVDAVISIFVEPVMVDPLPVVKKVYSIESIKPIYMFVMPLPEFWENYKQSGMTKPVFKNPEDPAEVISNILHWLQRKSKLNKNNNVIKTQLSKYNSKEINSTHELLPQNEVEELLKSYNLPFVESRLVTFKQIERMELNYPVVLKGISDKVIHKSELDAVKLNIKSIEQLIESAEQINTLFERNEIKDYKFLIQPFIKATHELLIGGFRDSSFGPVIMFGTGGKYVEVVDDTSMRSALITENDIDVMIASTKIGKILKGVRGEKSTDISDLKRIIINAAKMLRENRNVIEFDFNPLIVTNENTYHAVDVRIKLHQHHK